MLEFIKNNFSIFNSPLDQFAIAHLLISSHQNTYPNINVLIDSLTSNRAQHNCPFNIAQLFDDLTEIVYFVHLYILWSINAYSFFLEPTYIFGLFTLLLVVNIKINKLLLQNHIKYFTSIFGNFNTIIFKNLENIVKNVLKSNTNLEKKEYFNIFYTLFLFIFLSNSWGLIPYTFTMTSSFLVTFFLAAAHFCAINILAINTKKWEFFSIFLPSGVPLFITPFLVVIELISYVAKVLSLSIRLFANMMAGHALLKILIGFSWTMLASGSVSLVSFSVLPWIIVSLIFFLELLIAFLQAYVFIVLLAIYINDLFSAH